ncbi:MAG: sugar phosphate isomerase/epimerase [Tissierellales bacterium]|nr:sugar phosphate isomerase/epimerase [Tissierellales bacterium]MBN2826969.1 sugar phosphate isomerase/epimerase [Tissierellales bacterium]
MQKLGIYSWFGHMAPIQKRLDMIKKAGFDSTMLWWGDQAAFYEYNKDELIKCVLSSGLEVENIHIPYERINDLWDNHYDSAQLVSSLKEWVCDCHHYGISGLVMHVENKGLVINNPIYGIDNISRVLEIAERYHINIALENTFNYRLLEYIFGEIDSKLLKFCYDSSHDWLPSGSQGDIILKYGEKLQYLHLSDNDLEKDRHWMPDQGKIKWSVVTENLKKATYNGHVSFEVFPDKSEMKPELMLQDIYKFGELFREKLMK